MTNAETIVSNLNTSEYMARINCQMVIKGSVISVHHKSGKATVIFSGQPFEQENYLHGLIRGIEISEMSVADYVHEIRKTTSVASFSGISHLKKVA